MPNRRPSFRSAMKGMGLLSLIVLPAWTDASAYIDPGSGSLLVQYVLGVVMGVAILLLRPIKVFLSSLWKAAKGLFGR
ncbi:MAG TPA: hypothetical protein PK876_06475 [Elusimicrobiota bacterium]|nr:hypothetical protein [Elusimicrobiota bacterium]